jgi:hypothetical protein
LDSGIYTKLLKLKNLKSDEAGKSKGSKSSDAPLSSPFVMLLDAVKKGNARRYDDSSPVRTEIIPKTVIIRD